MVHSQHPIRTPAGHGHATASLRTSLWTKEGWLYLTVVLDIGTRRVIGWSLQETLRTQLVTSALDMALGARPVTPGLICHSDRGTQYGLEDVQPMMERYRLHADMSRKGNCWDNAVVVRRGGLRV